MVLIIIIINLKPLKWASESKPLSLSPLLRERAHVENGKVIGFGILDIFSFRLVYMYMDDYTFLARVLTLHLGLEKPGILLGRTLGSAKVWTWTGQPLSTSAPVQTFCPTNMGGGLSSWEMDQLKRFFLVSNNTFRTFSKGFLFKNT